MLRVESLALMPGEALRSPDRLDLVHLVGFGDRRKAQDFPRLLREDVPDEVVELNQLIPETARPINLIVAILAKSSSDLGGFQLRGQARPMDWSLLQY